MDTFVYYTFFAVFYFLGVILSILALWRARTPQGATAWIIGLISFPFITIPLFLIFGRNKFFTYVNRRKILDRHSEEVGINIDDFSALKSELPSLYSELESVIEKSRQLKFISGNEVEILIDENTIVKMLEIIKSAQHYILFQFYIFNDDVTGNQFIEELIKRSNAGVKVYFLFDGVGSRLSRRSIRKMKDAGIKVSAFKNNRSWGNRFQINFRNHRKLVVIDGHIAFIGGCNIADKFVKKQAFGPWRDTHLLIQGPSAAISQISFLKDWYWVNQNIIALNWTPQQISKDADKKVCVLHTGPADDIETCQLSHIALVNMCKKRLLISTPYFVPSKSFVNALILAAIRGCEIKIILPLINDNILVKAAEKVHIEKLIGFGIQFYFYPKVYFHQKAMLIDDHTSVLGSTNLDSRSFFINFEINAIVADHDFAKKVEDMLINDIDRSTKYDLKDLQKRRLPEKIVSRAANLLSPIL